jgi:hypothetical protein
MKNGTDRVEGPASPANNPDDRPAPGGQGDSYLAAVCRMTRRGVPIHQDVYALVHDALLIRCDRRQSRLLLKSLRAVCRADFESLPLGAGNPL